MLTDPVADLLTRIRNANKALHESASMPSSRLKVELCRILTEGRDIQDYKVERADVGPLSRRCGEAHLRNEQIRLHQRVVAPRNIRRRTVHPLNTMLGQVHRQRSQDPRKHHMME